MASSRRRRLSYLAAVSFTCTASAAFAAERVIENGTATWYGGRHVGRTTSSGEVFSSTELTAAHPYLPLGTRVRVTVAGTGSSVVVKINDRQPAHGSRIIDLSREAAAQLGMLGRGTAPVTVATVSETEPVEVAMAPDDGGDEPVSAPRRGRLRMRHARQAAAAARPCCHAPFVTQVRHSAPHPATRRTL